MKGFLVDFNIVAWLQDLGRENKIEELGIVANKYEGLLCELKELKTYPEREEFLRDEEYERVYIEILKITKRPDELKDYCITHLRNSVENYTYYVTEYVEPVLD